MTLSSRGDAGGAGGRSPLLSRLLGLLIAVHSGLEQESGQKDSITHDRGQYGPHSGHLPTGSSPFSAGLGSENGPKFRIDGLRSS